MQTKFLLLSSLLVTLLFSGCISTSITLTSPNNLEIAHNDQRIDISGELLEKKSVNLHPAMIYQSIFKTKEGEIIVYEYVDIDQLYRFQYGTSRSIDIIFEAKHVKIAFQFNNLYFFQVERKDGTYINVLVQQSDDQSMVFVTGFNSSKFTEMIKEVGPEEKTKHIVLKEAVVTTDPKKAVTSKWNIKMIAIDNIFAPAARMMP